MTPASSDAWGSGEFNDRPRSKKGGRKKRRPSRDAHKKHFLGGHLFEHLESRQMFAAIVWSGDGDGTTWTSPANWVGGVVPGATDDAVIGSSSQTIDISGNITVNSVTSSDPLDVTGGSFTVQGGTSQANDGLTVASGAALTATGSGTSFTTSGTDVIDGASFYAQSGASVSLPGATSYSLTGSATFEATGTGSKLSLANLTSISVDTSDYAEQAQFMALAGGTVTLSSLAQVDTGPVVLESDGTGSVLNVPSLTSLTGLTSWGSIATLQATNSGKVQDPLLTTLNNVNMTLDGTGTISTSQIVSFTGGTLTVSGGTPSFSSLADIDGSNFQVSGGATLSLPAATSYSLTGSATFEATGTGSELSLANLTSISVGTSDYAEQAQFMALAGGTVTLSSLAQIDTGPVVLESDGTGSVLNVPSLTSLTGLTSWGSIATLQATNSGTVQDPLLTTLNTVNLTLDGTGTISTSQIASYTYGTIDLSGGTPSFSSLANINDSNFQVSGGATLSLPAATSYSLTGSATFEATGTGSKLLLANLTSISVDTSNYAEQSQFMALAGGTVTLSSLAQADTGPVVLESDGAGSVLNVPSLTSLTGLTSWGSIVALQATDSGTVQDPLLTTLNDVYLTVDGTGIIGTSHLTDIDNSSLYVSGGGTLSLPGVTSYNVDYGDNPTLQASGAGSVLSLPNLSSMNLALYNTTVEVNALSGGQVSLPSLTRAETGRIFFESDGSGSLLNLAAMVSFGDGDNWYSSGLQATNSGAVDDPNLTTLYDVSLTLDGTGTIDTSQIITFTAGEINLSAGSPSFSSLTNIDDSSLYVSGGTLNLPGVMAYDVDYGYNPTLQADGAGSVLSLPNLSSITPAPYNSTVFVNALSGGQVSLPCLTQAQTGRIFFESDGSGSLLNLAALVYFADGANWYSSSLQAINSGTVDDPHLTTLYDVSLTLDGTGTIAISQIASFTAGQINLSGGTPSFSGLTDIDNSSLYVSGGTLSLPGVTAFNDDYYNSSTLQASGAGSVLSLPNLSSLNVAPYNSIVYVNALSGGQLSIPSLTRAETGRVFFESDGSGSVLDLSALVSFDNSADWYSSGLQATNSGTVTAPLLTTLYDVTLTLDGTGTIATSQITSLTYGQIDLSGGTPSFSGLTDLDDSSLYVSGGTLSLPAVTTYNEDYGYNSTLQASGAGVLSLPNLSSLNVATTNTTVYVNALSGGQVSLPSLTRAETGRILFESDGSGSLLNLAALVSFGDGGDWYSSGLQATNGGTVDDPNLTTLYDVSLTLDGTGTIATSQITSFTAGQINLSGGTPSFSGLTDIDDTSLYVSGGTLSLPGVTAYNDDVNNYTTLQASGAGSVLSLPNLSSLNVFPYNTTAWFQAFSGGQLSIPSLTQADLGRAFFESDGSGSLLNLAALVSLDDIADFYSSGLQATNSGTVSDPHLTTLNDVYLTLDGTGTIDTDQITAWTNSSLDVNGQTVPLTGLTNATGSVVNNLTTGESFIFASGTLACARHNQRRHLQRAAIAAGFDGHAE